MAKKSDPLKWLKKHKKVIRIREIERLAGIPQTTLSHAVEGRRDLPEEHLSKLLAVLKKYGYQP